MIKLLILLITISSSLPFLANGEEEHSSLYYMKLGALHCPGDSGILPSFGLGARFQKNSYGFDVSGNLSSLIFLNYASIKGMFLIYPHPEEKNQLYFGVGPGVGYHLSAVPLGGSLGSASNKCGMINLEAVLGYEFRHARHFKTFVQLELSQPTFSFNRHRHHPSYKPGIGFSLGIGF